MITENERSLFLISLSQPFLGLGLIPHIVLSDSWIEANTVVALKSITPIPIMVVKSDLSATSALWTTSCSPFSTSLPNNELNCAKSFPSTSWAKNAPILMITKMKGANEKIVT